MTKLSLGSVASFASASRWTITLSTAKQLVLFRLSHLSKRSETALSNNSDGEYDYFCMNQECPHAGGPMEDSTLEYDVEDDVWIASCPWHSYDFNVETGESAFGVKTCTYPITISNGEVWLELPGSEDASIKIAQVTAVSEAFKAKDVAEATAMDRSGTDESLDHNTARHPKAHLLADDASLSDWCRHILTNPDPETKIELTHHLYNIVQKNVEGFRRLSSTSRTQLVGSATAPEVPPRQSLKVIHPSKMPKRGAAGNTKSRIAILHSLANIEQWAIDLALDICIRFSSFKTSNGQPLPGQFFLDWIKVANDEAKHFSLLRGRLEELGSYFGELPVHHGLWDSATATAHDLRARISIIALVHEARGLDVNPQTIAKFRNAGDTESVRVLSIIHKDEITHVTTGHRWLSWICEEEQTNPIVVFRENVTKYFAGAIKGPFNVNDRNKAGLDKAYYEQLNGRPKNILIAGG